MRAYVPHWVKRWKEPVKVEPTPEQIEREKFKDLIDTATEIIEVTIPAEGESQQPITEIFDQIGRGVGVTLDDVRTAYWNWQRDKKAQQTYTLATWLEMHVQSPAVDIHITYV